MADFFNDHYSLDPRDPFYMSESELFAFAKKRDYQRTYGRFGLQEGEGHSEGFDVFSHFDHLTERQIVSGEPVQRAKDRMASALMRGGTTKMIKATSTRIKATKSAAKLHGISSAIEMLIKEPGMDLNKAQISALQELGKAAKLKASRMESSEVHMGHLRSMLEGNDKVAAKMKKKGYGYQIVLSKGEPLYAKTMAQALKVAKDHGVDPAKAISMLEGKEPKKLRGKKLDALISRLYAKNADGVQVRMMNLGKIKRAAEDAYASGGEEAADKAIAALVQKYREN